MQRRTSCIRLNTRRVWFSLLKRLEFDCLYLLLKKESQIKTQRELAQALHISLGNANSLIKDLSTRGLVGSADAAFCLTKEGLEALKPYKVRNAIIMAAGLASRCAPLSYEKPKGLFKVKDEILIERQIRQLQERGITEIYVVAGYMKELFFYLEKEFGVHIITNTEYYKRNNLSSIYAAKEHFGNSYICYSDNYIQKNGFEPYVYQSYFAAQYSSGYTDEYVIEANKKGLITQYYIGGENCWYQMGEMYFSRETAETFMSILEREYRYPSVADMKVDDFFMRHLSSLPVFIKKNEADSVIEFDTIAEIESFDDKFIQNMGESILSNISQALDCHPDEIVNVKQITRGNTNVIFRFDCKGDRYIYRHPGKGSEKIINRERELVAMRKAAEIGIDPTLIDCNPKMGWKLCRFIPNVDFDYSNLNDEKRGVDVIRRLHSGEKHLLGWELNMLSGAAELQALVPKDLYNAYREFESIRTTVGRLFEHARRDGYGIEMCHNDCCDSNILLGKDDTFLIDWEYAGDNDPAADIATFIIGCTHTKEQVDRILELYFQRTPTREEQRHYYAYIAICSYYYFSWGVYEESIGKDVGDLTYIWYSYLMNYGNLALQMYEE